MSETLLEAVRRLRVTDPDLGVKPLLAKLREQQPDLGAACKEVREALEALKGESKATKATAAPPAAEESGAPLQAALSLACVGCGRLPSGMDDGREKHPACPKCVKQKLPTTFWCGIDCPANPGARKVHEAYHKGLKKQHKMLRGGMAQQRDRELAERNTRLAAQNQDELLAGCNATFSAKTGGKYDELLADKSLPQQLEFQRKVLTQMKSECEEALANSLQKQRFVRALSRVSSRVMKHFEGLERRKEDRSAQLDAAEQSKALEEQRAEQAAVEAQRQSAEERACKEEKRRCAEAKAAAKEAWAREETVARREAQQVAAQEAEIRAEAQAAREREAAADRQRAKAEARRRREGGAKERYDLGREREDARQRQRPQQSRVGRANRGPRWTNAPLDAAAAAPPPSASLGDAIALALDQHAGRNPCDTARENLDEDVLVRRAIALTSSLRVEAPVFSPASQAVLSPP
eukprot:scaffold77728_cov65-Phaeocystis_antarctica.AAC.1